MNDQSLNQNPNTVKPCIKCGATDRYADGKCKPCRSENNKNWRKNNLEYHRKRNQKWRQDNPERNQKNAKEWAKKNPDYFRDYNHKWRSNNPNAHALAEQNRRSRKRNSNGRLSKDIVNKLMALQNGKCACCGASLKGGYHLDHIIPLALGGENVDNNVQLLTPKCNMSKGAKHPIDYMQSKGLLL